MIRGITCLFLGALTALLYIALTARVECKVIREVTLQRVSSFTVSCETHHWLAEDER